MRGQLKWELQRAENEIERLKDEIAGQDTAELARKRALQTEALKEEGRLTQSISSVRRDIDKIKEESGCSSKGNREPCSSKIQAEHVEGIYRYGSGAHFLGKH